MEELAEFSHMKVYGRRNRAE